VYSRIRLLLRIQSYRRCLGPLEAPPEAASSLLALFEGMARLMRRAPNGPPSDGENSVRHPESA
jgi:hypothetical protein